MTVQHGVPFSRIGYVPIESDVIYGWGMGTAILRRWGVSDIVELPWTAPTGQVRNDREDGVVLIALSSERETNKLLYPFVKAIVEACQQRPIVLRRHPGRNVIPREFKLLAREWAHVSFDREIESRQSIARAVVVATWFSSMIVEARELDVPVVVMSPSAYDFGNVFPPMEQVSIARSPAEACAMVCTSITEPSSDQTVDGAR